MSTTRVPVSRIMVLVVCAAIWSGHPTQAGLDITGYQNLTWRDAIYDVLEKTNGLLAITLAGQRTVAFHRTLAGAAFVAVAMFDDVQALRAVELTTPDGMVISEPQVLAIVRAYREKYGTAH